MKPLWRLLGLLRPYRVMVIAGILAMAGAVAAELAIPRLTQRAIDFGIRPGDMDVVLSSALAMAGMALVQALLFGLTGVFAARVSQRFAFDVRNTLFTRIQTLSYGNLDKLQTGQLMTRVASDVDMVRMFVTMGMRMLTRAPLMIIGSLVLIYLIDPQLAMIMLVIMPAMLLIIGLFAAKARPMFKTMQEKLGALNTVLQENLAGVRVVKAFVRSGYEMERFGERNEELYGQTVRVGLLLSFAFPVLFLLLNLSTLAVLWFGGSKVISGSLTVGELVAFYNYVMTAMFPMMMLGMMIAFLSGAGASADRICEILDMDSQVVEKDEPDSMPAMMGRVAFENVSFHYDGVGGEDVLRDVSFVAEPGETVALLGATGAGKSTLVNLIPRFYDVTTGQVSIDNVDIRDLDFDDLRRQIGIVAQDTTLFDGTIRENIAFGRPDATEEEIIGAAKAAQAHDFAMAMPEGYDSHVESRGTNLSGGQRQRVAIARALVMNPRILVLDDSTSSVDMETEYEIQQALEGLMEGRTSFIIAQRISSVLHADKIVVLERGEIAAIGSHRDLLESSPIYQDIYRSQVNGQSAPTIHAA